MKTSRLVVMKTSRLHGHDEDIMGVCADGSSLACHDSDSMPMAGGKAKGESAGARASAIP